MSDGAEMASQSFLFTSTNAAPAVPAVSPITQPCTARPVVVQPRRHRRRRHDTLTYTVQVSGYNPLYDLKAQLGLNNPPIAAAFNLRGSGEMYFHSSNGSNPAGSGYYV